MADRLCPFCGKPNPEDAEICAHCQARLISPNNPLSNQSGNSSEDLSNWLNSTREQAAKEAGFITPPGDSTEEGPVEKASKEETPGWLQRIRERSRAEQEAEESVSSIFEEEKPTKPAPINAKENVESPSPETPPPSAEKTDEAWLESLRTANPPEASPSPEPSSEPAAEENPAESDDWLKKVEEWKKPVEDHTGLVQNEQGVWVKPFHTSDLKAIEEHPELEAVTRAPSRKLPKKVEPPEDDWLEKTRREAAEQPASETPAQPKESVPDWLEELESTFPTPEPLKSTQKPSNKTKTGGVAPLQKTGAGEPSAGSDDEIPEWMKNVSSTSGSRSSAPAFVPGEEPKFTSPFSQPIPPAELISTPDQSGLTPAQLPEWLQALRPVESVLPENMPMGTAGGEKGTGPLAGLADVIPIEDESNPTGISPKVEPVLRVDDRQKLHAQLLESVLLAQGKEAEEEKTLPKKRSNIVRILISLLLLVLLAAPVVLGSAARFTPAPVFFAPETISMATGIKTLTGFSRVLVVFDYQPSLSGELKTAALPVIEQLMAQNTNLAVISTLPTGPVLAESLLASAIKDVPGFDAAQHVVNLGYLPGGAVGLQEFAAQPQYAAPFTWDRKSAWTSPALEGVSGVDDFHAILLMSESVDTTRIWLEQVMPGLPKIPVYLVTSAQSSAMLLPYFSSGQLTGMISGINGGRMFELLTSKPGAAVQVWDSYQIGILLILVIILMGGIISSLAARPPKAKPIPKE